MFIIACEGEKTEVQYFNFSFLLNSRVKLIVVPSKEGCSAPKYVLDNLKDCAKEMDLNSKDQLWLVIDVDNWDYVNQLHEVQNKTVKGKTVNLAISNPCFELFLYLHHKSMPTERINGAEKMETMLKKVLGTYSKNNLNEKDYMDYVNKAISESKKKLNIIPANFLIIQVQMFGN